MVRAIMRETGLKLGTPTQKRFVVRARELVEDERGLARMIEPLLQGDGRAEAQRRFDTAQFLADYPFRQSGGISP